MPPSHEASSIAAIARKCISVVSLRKARKLHAIILTTSPLHAQSPYLNNNILSMYARCGSLGDVHQLFDKMPQRNLVSFNAVISAYSRAYSHAFSVFGIYGELGNEGIKPNGLTFISLLQACCLLEDGLWGCLFHGQVVRLGFMNDTCVQTSLLRVYSSCESMECARRVFDCMLDKDVVAWNCIIFGCLKNYMTVEGFYLFGSMVKSGIYPTQFTYSMVLNACCKLRDYRCGQMIHAQVIVSNTLADLPLQNALLDMYCSFGDTETAFDIFRRMENLDIVSWNSMITGYSDNGNGEKAMDLFVQLCRMSDPKPDEYTFASIISATDASIFSGFGKPLHAQVTKSGFGRSVYVGGTLASMYFREGEIESAQKVFHSISNKDVVLWTEMITYHSRTADGESAMKFFREMCRESHTIDGISLSAALSACANLAALRQGEVIHSQAVRSGVDAEMSVCGSLIDMYSKNGNLEAAQSIFSRVSYPDLKCWNSMLGGYSHHGMAEEALKMFYEILNHNLKPDQVTFLSVLSACSHSGLVETGKFIWNHMKENGCTQGPKHYSCMVTLLCRAGLLNEAKEMIIKSPITAEHRELWRTLLSSCVTNKNLRMGLNAAEQVFRLDGEDNATHILLSNLFAATGRWDCVAEMRRKIRGLITEKYPGLSWLESANKINVFSCGDQIHPNVDEAEAELHRLQQHMSKTEPDAFDARIASALLISGEI